MSKKVVTDDILESSLSKLLKEKVLQDAIDATKNANTAITNANTATSNANSAAKSANTAADNANAALEAFAKDRDADSVAVQDTTNNVEYHLAIRLVDGKPVGVIKS